MKNYSSKRAKKGRLAYRTPDRFIPHQISKTTKIKSASNGKQHYQGGFGAGFIYRKYQQITQCKSKKK